MAVVNNIKHSITWGWGTQARLLSPTHYSLTTCVLPWKLLTMCLIHASTNGSTVSRFQFGSSAMTLRMVRGSAAGFCLRMAWVTHGQSYSVNTFQKGQVRCAHYATLFTYPNMLIVVSFYSHWSKASTVFKWIKPNELFKRSCTLLLAMHCQN